MNKNKFLYVAALFGMMVLVSCSSHDSAKNVTVTSLLPMKRVGSYC